MKVISICALAGALAFGAYAGTRAQTPASTQETESAKEAATEQKSMPLGNFSVSLAVKDIKKSKAFYEKLDFKIVGGKIEQNWIILQNGTTTIGLFQGLFEKNTMTFNPGWNKDKETPKEFIDVRELQSILLERGLELDLKAKTDGDGPAFFTLKDPDGNPIFFDQHVPKPKAK